MVVQVRKKEIDYREPRQRVPQGWASLNVSPSPGLVEHLRDKWQVSEATADELVSMWTVSMPPVIYSNLGRLHYVSHCTL